MATVPSAPGAPGENVLRVGTSGYQTIEVGAGTFHELRFHIKGGSRTRVTWVRELRGAHTCPCLFPASVAPLAHHCNAVLLWRHAHFTRLYPQDYGTAHKDIAFQAQFVDTEGKVQVSPCLAALSRGRLLRSPAC